jgi:hypothetical protein
VIPDANDNLYHSRDYRFLNVGPWTHIGIMQMAESPEKVNRKLFEHYVYCHAWGAAMALLEQPMDQEVDPVYPCGEGIKERLAVGDAAGAERFKNSLLAYLKARGNTEKLAEAQAMLNQIKAK